MKFALELKDLIYIIINVMSIVTVMLAFRNRIKNLEEFKALVKSVLFQNDATLNLINRQTCKDHRDNVYKMIRREAAITHKAFESIDLVNANIIKIALHMGLEPEERKREARNTKL